MDAAGKRLADLTGAEWGMVSSGCAAAMTHATAACVAGGNPDLHVRIPDLRGFAKDEVIIPTHSRNVYDAAIRAVGVRIVEAETAEDLEKAIGPRTAMIYVFANQRNETGPMSLEAIARIAKPHGVPIMVDAAAEVLTVPNVHLQRGATLVGYSGGKILRGPQSAGVLLGRKDLVQAAWIHSAPHHGFARSMKVGREEVAVFGTDGLYEFENARNELYTAEILASQLPRWWTGDPFSYCASVLTHLSLLERGRQADDRTMVVIRRQTQTP
jgi:L-seryl-tRNA(Ser) seleniumtransferase